MENNYLFKMFYTPGMLEKSLKKLIFDKNLDFKVSVEKLIEDAFKVFNDSFVDSLSFLEKAIHVINVEASPSYFLVPEPKCK